MSFNAAAIDTALLLVGEAADAIIAVVDKLRPLHCHTPSVLSAV